jgi:outer membrane receptor protein involved in Fe transport
VRAPDWSGNVGLSQSVLLANDLSLDFGAGANYVGPYYTVLSDLPGFVQKGYVKVDANVSLLRGKDKNWEFALIGRNLTNEITSGWCANAGLRNSIFGGQIAGGVTSGPSGGDDEICQAERGREIWGRLSVRF